MESKNKSEDTNTKRLGFGWILFVAIFFSGVGFWSLGFFGRKNNVDITPYTISALSGSLPGLIDASGELKAIKSVNLSPETQGLLERLYVSEGDQIKKDQLIAEMNQGDYLYRYEKIKADYLKDLSAFERRKKLFQQGAISKDQFQEYKNKFLSSKAFLRQIEIEGSKLKIRAPFNGVITRRYAEPGAFVAPTTRASLSAGSSSASIVELSQGLEVVAKVPESDIARIKIDQVATIRIDAYPEKSFKAEVIQIAPRSSSTDNVNSFEVKLSLINPPSYLRIGMTADVSFEAGQTEISTLVPTVAIVTKDGLPGVLVVGDNNEPSFQRVELGTSNGSQTSIIEGLSPGQLVFIDLPPWAKRNND